MKRSITGPTSRHIVRGNDTQRDREFAAHVCAEHPRASDSNQNVCLRLRFVCNGNLDVSTLFELGVVAVFIGQRIFDSQISMTVVRLIDSYLCFFRLATLRRDDFVDSAGHGDTGLF